MRSEEGQLYGATCQQWGVDPGAILEDDVLAYNLRVGLTVAMAATEREDEGTDHAGLIDQTRRAGAAIRSHLG